MVRRKFEGTVQLPAEVLLTEDALGGTFNGAVDPGRFILAMPRLPDAPGDAPVGLLSPVIEDKSFTGVSQWGYTGFNNSPHHHKNFSSWISHVAIKIMTELPEDADYVSYVDEFGGAFNQWWALAIQWLELWTEQVITPEQPSYPPTRGRVWEGEVNGLRLTGWGAILPAIQFNYSTTAASKRVVAAAFDKATKKIDPPVEWILLHLARRRIDSRIAVIDAASAAEVGLATAIQARYPHLTENAREQLIKEANGIIGLLRIVEKFDGLPEESSSWSRVAHRIANPRNDASHRGIVPTRKVKQRAFKECSKLLSQYSPLPVP